MANEEKKGETSPAEVAEKLQQCEKELTIFCDSLDKICEVLNKK